MYLTLEDALARLDRTVAACYDDDGELNADWLAADIATVTAQLDLHLAGRYATPVTGAAALVVLRGLALDLLQELSYRRLPSAVVPPAVTTAAAVARQTLAALAAGTLRLPDAPPLLAADLGASSNPPRFARAQLAGF